MGLDMRPIGKPKPGFEKRFNQIFRIIQGAEKQELTQEELNMGKQPATKEELLQEFFANMIPSYETVKAPRVGRDPEADEWAKKIYEQGDKKISEEEFMKQAQGYYVLDLAKETDGMPVYVSFGQDANVFRGKFLGACEDIIGASLVGEAWNTKLADDALDYGRRLLAAADTVAKQHNLEYLRDQRLPPEGNGDDVAAKLHIVYSLARWLTFYGSNGHGYEADF